MKFATLAALACAQAAALQNKAAINMVAEAMSTVEEGSEAHMHLQNAMESLTDTKSKFTDAEILASHSQLVSVPIDEKRALALKVSPTYTLDSVNSVTLKSFRKIVGYDTFESIRKKNRSEAKDTSDYYNVTVSMMIQRKPVEAAAAPAADPYSPNGAQTLASTLDKGFPYDDWETWTDGRWLSELLITSIVEGRKKSFEKLIHIASIIF